MVILFALLIRIRQAHGDIPTPSPTPIETPAGCPNSPISALVSCKAIEAGISPSLVLEIVKRESGFDPSVCNKKYGCGSGQGLMQIVPSTERLCEKRLGRQLDMFNPLDNLACGLWLLKQPNGISNWQPYSGPYTLPKEVAK